MPTEQPLLEVQGLQTKFFTHVGVVHAVDDISFSVGRGETVGLVGESGCGKSVSALSIMRLIPQPPGRIVAGKILFHDNGRPVDLLTLPDKEIRQLRGNKLSMIFQDPMTSLNPVLSFGYQLIEPLRQHLRLSTRESRRRAVELLDKAGIPAPARRLGSYPHEFSGGMRQRVMIAMAIACNPALLIADEPTTALDVTIQAQILELIARLNRELGTAVLMITHDLGVVAELCQRVVVMYAGQIVESAPARELYMHPRHPYTRGLMRSAPVLGPGVKNRLEAIKGMPPDLLKPPPGCRFRPRCDFRRPECNEPQELRRLGQDHLCRCIRPLDA